MLQLDHSSKRVTHLLGANPKQLGPWRAERELKQMHKQAGKKTCPASQQSQVSKLIG